MKFALWNEQERKRIRGRSSRVTCMVRRKSGEADKRWGVGRPRLSAIKIIPFLLAAERKELTSTLSRVPPGCYPLPLSSSVQHPLPLISSSPFPNPCQWPLVSIAILIVSSSGRMTSPRGTARNERTLSPVRGPAPRKPRVCGRVTMLYSRELLAARWGDCITGEVDNERPVQSSWLIGIEDF